MTRDFMKETMVRKDSRGEIYACEAAGSIFNVVTTKKGGMRGGDYHSAIQYNLVLQGRIKLTQRVSQKDVSKVFGPNQLIEIPSNVPHLLEAIADSVMIEWWNVRAEPETYLPYRRQVEESIKKLGLDNLYK